ncbi:Metallo-dependent phosphatase [Aureobasidium subglaciale]|nr:Metallo-dependent phosphatase [Aureobasidium subglaciale]
MSPVHSILFALAASTVSTFAIPILQPTDVLRLDAHGSFQLSVFSDLHFGEAQDTLWGPEQDINSAKVITSVLNAEPNAALAILNGDLITGENTFLHNSTKYLDSVVAPLVEHGMSWASTYGNHDSDFNLSREGIFAEESKYPLSRTRKMVSASDAGVSNYYLPVYGNASAVPEFLLWFFDSRGGNYFQQKSAAGNSVPQPNWVAQSVVNWFTQTRSALEKNHNRIIPSVAFVHIPVNAMAAFQATGVNKKREPGINDDNPLAQQGSASGQGDVSGTTFSYNGQDIPFMQALLDTKGLKAVFSGHDHGDDWCFRWTSKLKGMNLTGNGIDLCFDRRSGYGGYGSWTRGSRQVVLQKDKEEVETWVRMEDGSVSGKVTLNGTYGQDSYPAVRS